jgi:hypothetical protein
VDRGELRRRRGPAGLCVPSPLDAGAGAGQGRERNQVLDAGDVISLLRQLSVDLVLSGHRHVPYVWPVAGMFIVHSGTVSTLRTRGFTHPAYNLIPVEGGQIAVEPCIPGGEKQTLGEYPRDWPAELSARHIDPFAPPSAAGHWRTTESSYSLRRRSRPHHRQALGPLALPASATAT